MCDAYLPFHLYNWSSSGNDELPAGSIRRIAGRKAGQRLRASCVRIMLHLPERFKRAPILKGMFLWDNFVSRVMINTAWALNCAGESERSNSARNGRETRTVLYWRTKLACRWGQRREATVRSSTVGVILLHALLLFTPHLPPNWTQNVHLHRTLIVYLNILKYLQL